MNAPVTNLVSKVVLLSLPGLGLQKISFLRLMQIKLPCTLIAYDIALMSTGFKIAFIRESKITLKF